MLLDDVISRNKRNDRKFDSYMQDIKSYKSKVERGRSVRGVDDEQPAFSPQAEVLRQAATVDKANAYEKLMRRR